MQETPMQEIENKMSPEKRERLSRSGAVGNEGPAEPEYANESTTDQDTKNVGSGATSDSGIPKNLASNPDP